MISTNKIRLKEKTQAGIGKYFTKIASIGFDVQDFDPSAPYGGTKRSLARQRGYYKDFNVSRIHKLTVDLKEILESNHEYEALRYLSKCKEALTSKKPLEGFPDLQVIQFLPKYFFEGVNPEDMIAPNGLRVPESISQPEHVSRYSAKLLVPKLLLAAINGLQGMVPWTDIDMDLNSTVHAMRPDPGKNEANSGYGGGSILHHTDGYWNQASDVPLFVVVMAVSNPFHEPTSFISVQSIFQFLAPTHSLYSEWADVFSDLLKPDQSPSEFVQWVVKESQKPQFDFVMGIVGGDASRGVYETPLLEHFSHIEKYLFRAKSTFSSKNKDAHRVISFINRMLEYLARSKQSNSYYEQVLEPGEVYFSLNGSGLQIDLNASYNHNGVAQPVTGLGSVHGRAKLKSQSNQIRRTLIRGNSLLPQGGELKAFDLPLHTGKPISPINNLLQSGFRGNNYCR
jgi:hypothetical protein